jgi:hypothetical protein
MDEASARQVILAEAIESADSEGRLLSAAERDQVDRQARQDAAQRDPLQRAVSSEEFIELRARRVLAVAGVRGPGLLTLQTPGVWVRWLEWLLPLGAFVIGVATDAIGNPHRVDLVSLPLLGIVVWNLAIYLALLMGALWPSRDGHTPWLAQLGRWTDGAQAIRRRSRNIEAKVAASFRTRWFQATRTLHLQRWTRVLHLCAAAWALGVIASLLVRGLVVEYRVGWESTFLGPEQVYAILRVLRLPALLLAPFSDFTVEDVAQLRFSSGGGATAGAAWVWMYVALLVTVVIVPRLVLAAWCAWRENRLERRVPMDLSGAYYQRVLSLLQSARVQLALLATREEDRVRLRRVLAGPAEALPLVITTDFGDVLRLVEVPASDPPVFQPAREGIGAWLGRWRQRLGLGGGQPMGPSDMAWVQIREGSDVVVYAMGDDAREAAVLRWLDKPVLEVDLGRGGELAFESFGQCWIQDARLLDAIALKLPPDRRAGFARIQRTWEERNDEILKLSMTAIADHLLFAAGQVQEVRSGALTVRHLLASERQAQMGARQAAMHAIVEQLDESAARMVLRLHQTHGLDEASREAMDHRLEERFVVQRPVDASQAGVAGAATGAAMGASVDLLAGGLTLGAAAALGALLGGGAAYIAAAWKNRSTPTGTTVVQLSDEMLEALLEAALLRYIAVVHWARGGVEIDPTWTAQVAAVVVENRPLLSSFWMEARRNGTGPAQLAKPLAEASSDMTRKVLRRLYQM